VVRSISAWWRGQSHWLQHQQTGYSLVWVQHTTALAKWLAGLSGAALVLIYALYMRSYLSILSIRGDCVSREFVANVHKAGRVLSSSRRGLWRPGAGCHQLAGIGRLCRNRRNAPRQRGAKAPLQPGHEFDGLTENQVSIYSFPQKVLLPSPRLLYSWW
jgi:hypothetical protein